MLRGKKKNLFQHHILNNNTCEELSVEHVNCLVVPGILTLQVNRVQKVFNEGRQHHGQQDGILWGTERRHLEVLLVYDLSKLTK